MKNNNKKTQKVENAKRRNLWTASPVTKVVPDKKKQVAKKQCRERVCY